jgi:penicillin-binding protein 2
LNRLVFVCLVLFLFAATGCRPAQTSMAGEPLPTLARLPSEYDLGGAERVARTFLEAWQLDDFATMHTLLTFGSQEAYNLEAFTALYEGAHRTMTLDGLSYQGNTLRRETDAVATFNYSVHFVTRFVGEFDDLNRNMTLMVDERAGDWRVAWTPGDIFAAMAAGGRLRLQRIIPGRANIYDREGQIALANQNGRVVTVLVIRQEIPDYPNCLNALSAALAQPVEDVQRKLEERPADWLMDMGIIEAQTYLDTHGVLEAVCKAQFEDKPVREYPTGATTANIVGYVGFPDEEDVPAVEAAGFSQDSILGRSGIEASWDETLRGEPGGVLTIVNQSGELLREVARARSAPPQSVWLTIDVDLQSYAMRVLEDAYRDAAETWAGGSKGASIVVMNVNTGEILAMVSYPGFDNNAFTPFPTQGRAAAQTLVQAVQEDPRRPQLNRPTQGRYPLGSVMKTVSAVAIADSGVYPLDQRYTCIGLWNRDIARVDWLAGGHGTLTIAGALTQSCNPFFYEVGYQLDQRDPNLLPGYMREVGFGDYTGLTDIPEAPGLVADPEWLRTTYGYEWTFSEAVNLSIGQGFVEVTPLQVVRWFAAIANGGTLYRPQLVRQVGILGETPSHTLQPDAMREVNISRAVMDMERSGLCAVTTSPQGTAEFVFRNSPLQALGVCGKTGTAQATGEGVSPHAWFAAYAPRDNPEIAVVVMVENSGEGSGVAAPLTKQVLEYYFFRQASS